MSLQKIFFFIATVCALISTPLFSFPLLAYAPYLMWVLMHKSLKEVLWHSLLCGAIIDMLQSTCAFGTSSLCYVLVALVLYRYKWWFFNDKLGSLSLFSLLFSILFSFLQWISLNVQTHTLQLSWYALMSDFILMPICDSLYAFICFTAPLIIYEQIKKRGFHFLFMRKLN